MWYGYNYVNIMSRLYVHANICKYLPVDIHFMLILLVKHSSDTYIRNYICKVIDDLIIKIYY